MNHLQNNYMGIRSCIVFTDSASLVSNFLKFKSGVFWDLRLNELSNNRFLHQIALVHIPRHFNSLADAFAKEGAGRKAMLAAWSKH